MDYMNDILNSRANARFPAAVQPSLNAEPPQAPRSNIDPALLNLDHAPYPHFAPLQTSRFAPLPIPLEPAATADAARLIPSHEPEREREQEQEQPMTKAKRHRMQKNKSQNLQRERTRWLQKNAGTYMAPGEVPPKWNAMSIRGALQGIEANFPGVVPEGIRIQESELGKQPAGKGTGRGARRRTATPPVQQQQQPQQPQQQQQQQQLPLPELPVPPPQMQPEPNWEELQDLELQEFSAELLDAMAADLAEFNAQFGDW